MKTGVNAFLLTGATALVGLGATVIDKDLWAGVIEIVVGAGLFVLYELFPSSQ